LPELTLTKVVTLIGPAFTIALLGAIESLLSAVVADGMAGTRHDSNQELIGQGIANVFAPLFGGFAATGAIARTATNIRAGASSPLAGITHSALLVLIVLILAPWAGSIPLCALSAILFVVAYNMSELHHFGHLLRTASRQDISILLITFCLTVLVDLVIAVNVGVALASLLFMGRMAQAVEVQEADPAVGPAGESIKLPPRTLVYAIDGPFFFGAAEKLQRTLDSIQQHADTVVLRMGRVPFVDATGMLALTELIEDFRRTKTRVVLCEVRPNVLEKLERSGALEVIGKENLHPTLTAWLATSILTTTATPP
jgi:SulP family sulfate permease